MDVDSCEVTSAAGRDEELAAANEEQEVVEYRGEGVGHGRKRRGGGTGAGGDDVSRETVADDGGVERGADHAEAVELADDGAGETGCLVENRVHCCCFCNGMDVDKFVGDVDTDSEVVWFERDLTLCAIEDGVVGPGGDDDDVTALGTLGGQDGDVVIAVQANDGKEIYTRARGRVGEVAGGVVDIGGAIRGITCLDLLQMSVRGGVVEAGDDGEVACLGVVLGEEERATAAAIEVLVDEAGGGANPVGTADVGVVAVVGFGVDLGEVRACLGGWAEETAVENINGAVAEDTLSVSHCGTFGVVETYAIRPSRL